MRVRENQHLTKDTCSFQLHSQISLFLLHHISHILILSPPFLFCLLKEYIFHQHLPHITIWYSEVFLPISLYFFFFFFGLLFLNWFNSQMVHEFPVYLTLVLCSKVLKFWVFFKGRQWKETLNLLLLCNLYHQLHFLSKLNLGPKQKNQLININPLCVQELLNHPLSTPSYPLIRNLLSVIPKFVGFGYSCSFNH